MLNSRTDMILFLRKPYSSTGSDNHVAWKCIQVTVLLNG